MPVHVLHGDPFLVQEALEELRAAVGPPEVLEANSHRYQGDEVKLGELQAVCAALPFLARARLVVVEGLMTTLEQRSPRGRGERREASRLSEWEGVEEAIQGMPPTTVLVFAEGPLRQNNRLLTRIGPHAEVRSLPAPRREELTRWTRRRVEMRGAGITPGALRLLGDHVGPNLRLLDTELEKLSLFAGERPIEEGDVRALVPQVREASIFVAVDAILEGRSGAALPALHQLRVGGANLSYILTMVARQLRLVTLAKEMLEQGAAAADLGPRLEIRAAYPLQKTVEQARRFPWHRLEALYARLLEMDLAVKEGRLDEDVALELMVAESAARR